jgi:hypothetical protein
VESSVADDPLGRGLEPGGREAGPLGVDEALERGRVIAEGEVVGEAGRKVRVSEDVSRPAEENGGVRAREGCVEGSERDASAEARGGVRGDGRESGEERGEGGERDAAVAGEVVEDEVGVGGGQRRHRAGLGLWAQFGLRVLGRTQIHFHWFPSQLSSVTSGNVE